ncbi:hypothetical protein PTSG_01086 [Salpingoeca rosetta]|uniref:Derlin n=1 Tax=Salpingoeca rosetta (strain ATCC 50818 / BSB-021) TaxID=946362 RepID=F2U0S0_SALR5|nr:uncharacterized protein PTSG_01086 [Salpingoeca rosetta]EGD80494.1 hypothetical protein PTSG_01086 [Salpingoeca rosetta]|eukprot:XP_004997055.1 hypothetical protein PTSG_01086 [Salpingoeca rosetta]
MDLQQAYANIPPITKTLVTGAMVITLAGNFGLLPVRALILDFYDVWYNFAIWRLVTSVFFFGKLGFPFLINVYFLYNYSMRIETAGLYDRQPADYVFMLLVHWVTLLVIGYFLALPIIGIPLVLAIMHVWCNVNPDVPVRFWFGLTFKALYLPWVLLVFNILTGGTGMMELLGILTGHVFYFIKYKWPELGGPSLLETPQFLREFFPNAAGGVAGFGEAPASRQPQAPRDPQGFAGRGHVLGNN